MSKNTNHLSSSIDNSAAEGWLLEQLGCKLGINSLNQNVEPKIEGKSVAKVKLDGFAVESGIIWIIEVATFIGEAKPGQKNKVAKDVLKLLFVRQQLLEQNNKGYFIRAIILFGDNASHESSISNNSWLRDAMSRFGIESKVLEYNEDWRTKLVSTKKNQQREIPPNESCRQSSSIGSFSF